MHELIAVPTVRHDALNCAGVCAANPLAAVLTLSSVIIVIVEVVGFMHWWGFTIDSITCDPFTCRLLLLPSRR